MSKIVCDVCGSSYSETETQCPICGTARPEEVKPVVETTMEEQSPKSGKFSQTNTKKSTAERQNGHGKSNSSQKKDAPSNTAMIAIVAVLLLAIVAVCVFIFVRALDNNNDIPPVDNTSSSASSSSTADPVVDVPCTGIELVGNDSKSLTFTVQTESAQLNVKALPEDTTDNVTFTFTSSDPAVVTVSSTGLVTPVANGTATITVTYGEYSIAVAVTCEFAEVVPTLELTKDDITLSSTSTSYDMYNLVKNSGKFDKDKLVVTSSDESYVRVDGTKVVAVDNIAKGVTVTVEYEGQTAECLVRVQGITATNYSLSTTDITLTLGKEGYESFELKLIDKSGNAVKDVTWQFSNDFPKCCESEVDAETGIVTITAKAVTSTLTNGQYVLVYTTYDGVKYQCKIYVNALADQE